MFMCRLNEEKTSPFHRSVRWTGNEAQCQITQKTTPGGAGVHRSAAGSTLRRRNIPPDGLRKKNQIKRWRRQFSPRKNANQVANICINICISHVTGVKYQPFRTLPLAISERNLDHVCSTCWRINAPNLNRFRQFADFLQFFECPRVVVHGVSPETGRFVPF